MSVRDGPFHPLQIEATACDLEIARRHLEGFIKSFIRHDGRSRAQHILFRLALKKRHRMRDIHKLLDERFTSPPQQLCLPASLPRTGMYFAGGKEAWILSLPDAEVVSGYLGQDAVWSGVCGSYAAFLYHENLKWLCYRRPIADG